MTVPFAKAEGYFNIVLPVVAYRAIGKTAIVKNRGRAAGMPAATMIPRPSLPHEFAPQERWVGPVDDFACPRCQLHPRCRLKLSS